MARFAELVNQDETRARLIGALDIFTRRDLIADPPADQEAIAQLGVGATNLDRSIRPWINQTFRDALGLPRLLSGEVKTVMKFSALLALCKAQVTT